MGDKASERGWLARSVSVPACSLLHGHKASPGEGTDGSPHSQQLLLLFR